jgi:hypothetical protein
MNSCCFLLFVLFGYVLTQNIPLSFSSTPTPGSLLAARSVTYSINQNRQTFELNCWRTNTLKYSGFSPLSFVVKDPNNLSYYSFNGQSIFYPSYTGNYTLTISNTDLLNTVQYQVRACSGSCSSSSCPFSTYSGYCYGNGACNFNTKLCTCDNITTSSSVKLDSSCNQILDLGLFYDLLGLWIFLIILGFFLVCILPIICCCCCGFCVAAAATDRQPIVTHHHHHSTPNETTPVYVPSPTPAVVYPAPGVQYVQAQPVPQPGIYPTINPQFNYKLF